MPPGPSAGWCCPRCCRPPRSRQRCRRRSGRADDLEDRALPAVRGQSQPAEVGRLEPVRLRADLEALALQPDSDQRQHLGRAERPLARSSWGEATSRSSSPPRPPAPERSPARLLQPAPLRLLGGQLVDDLLRRLGLRRRWPRGWPATGLSRRTAAGESSRPQKTSSRVVCPASIRRWTSCQSGPSAPERAASARCSSRSASSRLGLLGEPVQLGDHRLELGDSCLLACAWSSCDGAAWRRPGPGPRSARTCRGSRSWPRRSPGSRTRWSRRSCRSAARSG